MSNPDSSNASEDKGVNAQNIGNHFTYTIIKRDYNITTVFIGENIKTNNHLAQLRLLAKM